MIWFTREDVVELTFQFELICSFCCKAISILIRLLGNFRGVWCSSLNFSFINEWVHMVLKSFSRSSLISIVFYNFMQERVFLVLLWSNSLILRWLENQENWLYIMKISKNSVLTLFHLWISSHCIISTKWSHLVHSYITSLKWGSMGLPGTMKKLSF